MEQRPTGWYGSGKRLIDIVAASAMLVLLSPFMLMTALAIRIDSPGPALFRQRRIGGEMTLAGSRPALFNQNDLIAMRQDCGIDALRPGVTGWAQIHGRDGIALQEKLAFDRYYLERCSP